MTEEIDNIKAGLRDHHARLKRLESLAGSEALTGFVDAKRADETGRAEGLPQSLAVSPVKAPWPWIIRVMVNAWREEAEKIQKAAGDDGSLLAANSRGYAAAILCCAAQLESVAKEPESEQSENAGDGKLSQESVEASADSNNGTASGRRNDKMEQPAPTQNDEN